MKKIVSIALAAVLVLGISAYAISDAVRSGLFELLDFGGGTTYYIDSVGGDDTNSGTSEENAWKTLDKVNSVILSGGDKVLFKSGCTFIGQLMPQGSGSAESGAVIIGKYGSGAKPVIDANGATGNDGAVIRLYNQEYIEISDLELKNNSFDRGRRNGVLVLSRDFGTADHIYIRNCDIHDVLTNARKETLLEMQATGGDGDDLVNTGSLSGAIVFMSLRGGDRVPTRYNDILIDGNTIARTGTNGSGIIFSSDWNGFSQDGYNDDGWSPYYGSTNVLISNNDLKNTAQAIRLQAMDGGVGNGVVVEYNVSYKPDNSDSNSGMWLSSSRDVIWQYNEIYGLDNGGMNDCGAFDADGNTERTVFQYNYTHDNRGEAVMICNIYWNEDYAPTNAIGNIFRYNISQNDMWGAKSTHGRLWVQKGSKDSYFYNNVIYVGEGLAGNNIAVQESENTYFYNNIFINESDASTYSISETATTVLQNNCFYGYHPESEPALDSSNIILNLDDPSPVVDAGSGGTGIDTLQGYMLSEDSPCIGSGKTIENCGYKDFYGNTFTKADAVDIGVHQTTAFIDNDKPEAFEAKASATGFDSISVSWDEAADNAPIDRYVVYVNGEPVGAAFDTSWEAEDLIESTEYSFFVRAFDPTGNYTDSNTVTAVTEGAQSGEKVLNVSAAAVYDVDGNACGEFSPEDFIAPRFTVADGNNNPVKNARVEVLVEAAGQNDYKNLASYTDENGIAQPGFYADYYPADTQLNISVTNVVKEGYTYNSGSNDTATANVSGSAEKNANLISNSDFDTPFVLEQLPGWTVTKSDGCNVTVESDAGFGGGNALKVTSDSAFEAQISQTVTGIPDGIYSLTMWVKNTADSLVVTVNDVSCIIGTEEEWKQISVPNVSVESGKTTLNIGAVGEARQYTLIDRVELSKNLLKNSLFEDVHPGVHLPSNYYYSASDITLSADGSGAKAASESGKLSAVSILPDYGAEYLNAVKIGDDSPFDVKMGQTLTNLENGIYTFYVKAVNTGGITGTVTVKNYGGEEVSKNIAVSSKASVTKIGGIEVTNGIATVELSFSGGGNGEEYIILSELNFSSRTDYPEHATVTPARCNLLNGYNWSFENNTTTAPAKWKNLWSRGKPECYVTDEDAHSGSYSTKIVLSSSDDAINFKPAINTFTGLSTGYYTFGAWVKGTFKTKVTAAADDINAYEKYSNISDEWHYVEISDILVEDGTLSVGFWNAISTDGEVYVLLDDVSLVRSTASYDIVVGIEALPEVSKGDTSVTLPTFEGFDISVFSSLNEDIIKPNGNVIMPRYDTVVTLELCVTNQEYETDVSYVTVDVLVRGMQTDPYAAVSFIFGDANFDGSADIIDIVRLKKYLSAAAADINLVAVDDDLDGVLTVNDLVALKKIILKCTDYGAYSQGEALWNDSWDELLN